MKTQLNNQNIGFGSWKVPSKKILKAILNDTTPPRAEDTHFVSDLHFMIPNWYLNKNQVKKLETLLSKQGEDVYLSNKECQKLKDIKKEIIKNQKIKKNGVSNLEELQNRMLESVKKSPLFETLKSFILNANELPKIKELKAAEKNIVDTLKN